MACLKFWNAQSPSIFCFGIGESFNFTLLNKDKVPSEPTKIFEVLKPLGLIRSRLYPPTRLCVLGKFSFISFLLFK